MLYDQSHCEVMEGCCMTRAVVRLWKDAVADQSRCEVMEGCCMTR